MKGLLNACILACLSIAVVEGATPVRPTFSLHAGLSQLGPKFGADTDDGHKVVNHTFAITDGSGRSTMVKYEAKYHNATVLLDHVMSVIQVTCEDGTITFLFEAGVPTTLPFSNGSYIVGSPEWNCNISQPKGTPTQGASQALRVKLLEHLPLKSSSTTIAFSAKVMALHQLFSHGKMAFSSNQGNAPPPSKAVNATRGRRRLAQTCTYSYYYGTVSCPNTVLASAQLLNWNYNTNTGQASGPINLDNSGNSQCANCYAYADVNVDFAMQVGQSSYATLDSMSLSATGSAKVNVDGTISMQYSNTMSHSSSIGPKSFPSINFFFGPIPVSLVFSLGVTVDASATVDVAADMKVAAQGSGSITYGMQYDQYNGFSGLHSTSQSFTVTQQPSLSANANLQAHVAITPTFTLTADSYAHAHLDVAARADLTCAASSSPMPSVISNNCPASSSSTYIGAYCGLTASLALQLGSDVAITVWHVSLINKAWGPYNIYSRTWNLYNGCWTFQARRRLAALPSAAQVVAVAAPGSNASPRIFTGHYSCYGSQLSATLQLNAWDPFTGALSGQFTYNSLAAGCSTSYTVAGWIKGAGSAQGFSAIPTGWVPGSPNTCNSPAAALFGQMDSDMTTITAQVSTLGCTPFQLNASGTLPQCINNGVCDSGESASCADCVPLQNGLQVCSNLCSSAYDNVCDDGGAGSSTSVCAYGSDCFDCGNRAQSTCSNTCGTAHDGVCQDGGPAAPASTCAYGTDCGDCGNRPNQDQDCVNTCPYSFDGVCDDGGNFSSSSVCAFGTDCGDCGSRGAVLCSDTCKTAGNGYCHDGGTGSGGSDCAYGTDCSDCGVRVPLQSVSGAPGAVLSLQSGGLLTAGAKCTSVKDCSGKGWCNTTIGVCHCGAGYTGPSCAELLPAVSSPMTQCLYGNCTPAKGLVACPQLNNKMVCAANASHLLKLDGDVGLQLNHYFWAKGGGPFCMQSMRAFLCAQAIPLCNADSTTPPVCHSSCVEAYSSCGGDADDCAAVASSSTTPLATPEVQAPSCLLAPFPPVTATCAIVPNNTAICPGLSGVMAYVEPSVFSNNISFAMAQIDSFMDGQTAGAANPTCQRALKDLLCASLLPECGASTGINQPMRMCLSACVQMLEPCSNNDTANLELCDTFFHTTETMSSSVGSKQCGYSLGVSSFVVKSGVPAASDMQAFMSSDGALVLASSVGSALLAVLLTLLVQFIQRRGRVNKQEGSWKLQEERQPRESLEMSELGAARN